jgi:hypothetical protein
MEFYSGTVAKGPPPSTAVKSRSTKMSPSAAGAPSDITEAAFSRWKVELQNKLIVEQEKQAHRDRLQYKKHEDSKYWERKQALCKKTVDQFGKAKLEMEAIRQANLTRGAEYKAELEEMKEMAAAQREEWMQFGHELTVQHGPEQTERTRARLAETAELKSEQGRQVKQLSQANKKQRHVQRTARLEEKRQIVESTKQQLFGSAEEAKNFAFHQREEIGGEVRRTEPAANHEKLSLSQRARTLGWPRCRQGGRQHLPRREREAPCDGCQCRPPTRSRQRRGRGGVRAPFSTGSGTCGRRDVTAAPRMTIAEDHRRRRMACRQLRRMQQAPGRCAALTLHGPVRPSGGVAITHSENNVASANANIPSRHVDRQCNLQVGRLFLR